MVLVFGIEATRAPMVTQFGSGKGPEARHSSIVGLAERPTILLACELMVTDATIYYSISQ